MSGRVEAIWSKRSHGGVMDPARDVIAVEGKGLEGDANFGATRQVTVIEKEVFDRILAELPGADPAMRRANIMVSGIRLEETRMRAHGFAVPRSPRRARCQLGRRRTRLDHPGR